MSSKIATCVGGENEGIELELYNDNPFIHVPIVSSLVSSFDDISIHDTIPINRETYKLEKIIMRHKTYYILVIEDMGIDEALERVKGLQLINFY